MRLLAVFSWALATCTIVTRRVFSSRVPVDDIERLLSTSHEVARQIVDATEASHSAPAPLDLDGSWADIFHQSAWVDQPTVGRPVSDVQRPDLTTVPSTSLLEHTPEQRRQMLETVKDHFYFVSEQGSSRVGMPRDNHLIAPYRPTMDQPLFGMTMQRTTRLGRYSGMYPQSYGSNRYMLQQASQRTQDFRQLYGFSFAQPTHTWYHVYHVKSRSGTEGVFELLGAIRGPHKDRNSVYRELYLGKPSVALTDVEAIGPATFKAHIRPYAAS